MGRLLMAFILVVSLVGCGGKIEENDGAEITTIMKDLATSVETGIGVPRTTEEALKYIRTRVDQSAIIKAYAPPTIVRTNPAIHVNRLLIRAGYDINRKLFTTSWALKHDDKTSAWTLSSTSFRDIQRQDLRYKPEDAIMARVHGLIEKLQAQGAPVHIPTRGAELSVTTAFNMLRLRRVVIESDGLFSADSKSLDILSYYANAMEHWQRRSEMDV